MPLPMAGGAAYLALPEFTVECNRSATPTGWMTQFKVLGSGFNVVENKAWCLVRFGATTTTHAAAPLQAVEDGCTLTVA